MAVRPDGRDGAQGHLPERVIGTGSVDCPEHLAAVLAASCLLRVGLRAHALELLLLEVEELFLPAFLPAIDVDDQVVGSEQESRLLLCGLRSTVLNLPQPAAVGAIEVNGLPELGFPHHAITRQINLIGCASSAPQAGCLH